LSEFEVLQRQYKEVRVKNFEGKNVGFEHGVLRAELLAVFLMGVLK
jgi:hypothetical protein